ncbi:WavE lipopolysaccharide synthesis family protein [Photobacterium ganghwense]|uniref:WavE lipopolysaccharide synthesis family protein n=1 Tax=Photobacterium ganghwense TaxID=320778 RepID=UPI00405718A2
MSQDFQHISVVVQGPVQNYKGRTHHEEGITKRCLDSIRTHLPGATVILSTWPDQDLSGLDYDLLVISEDPGQNSDGFCPVNYYRQIVSTKAGLARVTTPYAVKLRSDNFLTGNEFVALQQAFPCSQAEHRVFAEKVVINANLFRRTSHGQRVIMSPSDFFYYGRTDDVRKIWDQPPFTQQPFATELMAQATRRSAGEPALEAEQVYCQIWLKALLPERTPLMASRFTSRQQDITFWESFLASNIIIADPENSGIGLRKISIRKLKRANEYSHIDWLRLYRKYCDARQPMTYTAQQLLLELRRLFKLPLSKLVYKLSHR